MNDDASAKRAETLQKTETEGHTRPGRIDGGLSLLFAIAVFRKAALRDAQRGARPREASTSCVVTVPMVAATSVAPSPLESAKPISPWYHVKMTNGQTPAQMG